ncbi:DNA polymerase III subunit alpha [Porphyromonas gingivalis]|uniref:DNA polymerase III subunit alpha n=1 Tax=Porphyromonas gingivalis (strain ATCC 33277 / DSM 20709 / CIP 103683 / JCM 12257 / NCTC 11834 / 2561) TaxID=431947 RepID=B2RGQ8_PORG3|nr:DNA polymerase III subunit alpha [Porphyromonas gingivalis]AIJ34968.1 DNA polymerase III subunit alpha [Porphyromonas gingivalis]ALJ24527.1 DNA-directed DNA polymerase III PolC [Porphyromonas gingivalis 381]AUR48965.1 DNA polymerase III subunit alpha [Porphyromonas gingivalis ATCC 33277]MDR4975853.1 DNA polymerase III subunit alpha [Porphyromonas gingivalis]SJL20684.1 DNA polymerase III subunit alpha [Porphyromonas gingivalis]
MEPFVHLHVHSQFSLLDGQAAINDLVDKAIADGMPGIALTDHGAMFGIKEFYNYVEKKNSGHNATLKDCRRELDQLNDSKSADMLTDEERNRIVKLQQKIEETKKLLFKPILGCEAYCARRTRFDKDNQIPDPYHPRRSIDASGWHLILLAKNLRGYKNLIKMVSYSWTEGQYYRPRIDRELLQKYHEGIIVSSACLGGEIPQHIMAGEIAKAEEAILWFKELFGDDYYLEVQRHETHNPLGNQDVFPQQQRVNRVILELGKKLGVKVIATNDVHFCNEEDAEAHDRLICLSTGKDLDDPNRMRYTKQEWMKTTAEMSAIFEDLPETLSNTLEILDKVEFYSIDNKALMPDFPIPPEYKDDDDYLRFLTYEGARRKYGEDLSDEIKERIDFELETIKGMGFPGYFLIVQDFIAAARSMGVSVGPGRGSAAGSAVAYCLGITDIDPIKYHLLFERFLNPDRISMPDIDVDFDDDGRAEILRWVTEKYGKERVAHIITYGTMATKSSIKDVARVQRLPLPESNRLAKLVPDKIPGEKKVNLKKAIEFVPELKQASLSSDKVMRDTLKYAQMLEGNVRNTGVHACGIIIGKTDISDVVPVSTAPDKDTKEELLVTQYEGSVIEQTGLIKMDFLGLKTLSIIKEALVNIKRRHGIDLNIDTIPLDDPLTYKLYSDGRTIGTFQFESGGMQKYLRELQPSAFEDLIAMNALYRPGPMDYIPSFIARKHGREPIDYDLPEMEEYLKETYGVTVYQEQVMLLSRKLAGFTRGQSDELRKAMGKKLIEKMNVLKVKFLEGGNKNGHPEEVLEKIWTDWEKFASYAFNKSHATCYSWVAYQTAYLKANYPAEYMAGALSRNLNNITEITKLMDECKSMKIGVLVPDVNESEMKFSVNANGDIRFGLSAVKGVGSGAVEQIIAEREANGLYKDIFDFVERINLSACNRKTMESLALAGAFDSFALSREEYMAPPLTGREESYIQALMRYGSVVQEEKHSQSNSLFGEEEDLMIPRPQPSPTEPWNDLERLNKERELVGLYLSSNPMAQYQVILDHYCNTHAADLTDPDSLVGKNLVLAGIVTKAFQGISRSNNPYSKITLEDLSGTGEIPLFGQAHVNFGNYCKEGLYLLIRASVQPHKWKEGEMELVVTSIELLPQVADTLIKKMTILLPASKIDNELIEMLSDELTNNSGKTMLFIKVYDHTETFDVELAQQKSLIKVSPELVNRLKTYEINFALE